MLSTSVMNVIRNKPLHHGRTQLPLPVLIPCKKGERHDGVANFYRITQAPAQKVRLLRDGDISDEAIKRALSVEDQELLYATLALKGARERNDSLISADVYRKLMPHLGWPADTDPKVFSYPGWANVHVPRLATETLKDAGLVLWFASGKFVLAIYCQDVRTAIFIRAFLSLQRCPHCGIIFLPDKENRIYCRPSHGQEHRVARMRAKKKGRKRHA